MVSWFGYSLSEAGSCDGLVFKDGQFHFLAQVGAYGSRTLFSASDPTDKYNWTSVSFFTGAWGHDRYIKKFVVCNNIFFALGSKQNGEQQSLFIAHAASPGAATVYNPGGTEPYTARDIIYDGSGYVIVTSPYNSTGTRLYYSLDLLTYARLHEVGGTNYNYLCSAYFDGKAVVYTQNSYSGSAVVGLTCSYSATPSIGSSWINQIVNNSMETAAMTRSIIADGVLWIFKTTANALVGYKVTAIPQTSYSSTNLALLLSKNYSIGYFYYDDLIILFGDYDASTATTPSLVCGNFLPTISLDVVYTYTRVKEGMS